MPMAISSRPSLAPTSSAANRHHSASEWWLDLGSGIDAEHWAATDAPPGVRRIAMDPLLTSGMAASGRLAVLPPDIRRVGAELRPLHSVERGKQPSFLPFVDGAFRRVHCGFVLHLYLEVLELLAEETFRVLQPGGELQVLLPHFGDPGSDATFRRTASVLAARFGNLDQARAQPPFTTFWADLYQDKTWVLRCRKPAQH